MNRLVSVLCLLSTLALFACTASTSTQSSAQSSGSADAPSSPQVEQEPAQELPPSTDPDKGHQAATEAVTPDDPPHSAEQIEAADEPQVQTTEALATRLEGFLGYDELLFYDIDGEVCYCIENDRGTPAQCQARRDQRVDFAHRMSDCVGQAVREIELPPPASIFTYMTCLEDTMERAESCMTEALEEAGADCFEDRRHAMAPCRSIFMSSVENCEGPLRQHEAGSAYLNEIESQLISNQCHVSP